jgi:HK97 family phage major capsid protein
MTDKEKLEQLIKEGEQAKARMAELAEKKGHKDSQIKTDAIQKDEVEKMLGDLEAKLEAKYEAEKKAAAEDKLPKEMFGSVKGETFGAYLQKVRDKDPDLRNMKASLTEGSDAQGGYLVPSGTANFILGELNDPASVPGKTTPFPHAMTDGNVKTIPKWLTDISVGWVSEKGVKTETKPTFTEKTSTLKVMAAIITATDELRADNIVGLDRLLAEKIGENFEYEVERIILVGDVTGLTDPFNGIVFDAAIAGTTQEVQQAGGALAYTDLVAIQNNTAVLEKYRTGAEWIMNRSVWAKIIRIVDGNGRPLWSLQPINNKIGMNLLGDNVIISNAILNTHGDASNTSKIIWGNLKNVLTGFKDGNTGITVNYSDSAIISTGTEVTTNLWTQDTSGWRFTMRKSSVIGNPDAFSVGDEIK